MALQDSLGFLDVQLTNWLNAQGGPAKLINDIVALTDEFGILMREAKFEVDGGKDLSFKTMLRKAGNVGFTHPYKAKTVAPGQHLVEGTLPWTFYQGLVAIEETQEILNSGKGKLFDMTEVGLEAMKTEAAEDLETYWWDPAGNMDEQTIEDKPFMGLLAWLTLLGYAANHAATVAGISCTTDPRWSSRFACPLGNNMTDDFSMDTADKLTSANDLRRWIKKAARYARFASPNGLKWAQNDTAGDRGKFARQAKFKIYANELAYEALEATQLALSAGKRPDDRDIDMEGPTVGGIPVTWAPKLGFGAAGIPSYLAGTARSQTLTAGEYANTGMVAVVNLNNFGIVGVKGAFPKISPFNWWDEISTAVKTFKWFFQTWCNSRARQSLLWGFSPILPG